MHWIGPDPDAGPAVPGAGSQCRSPGVRRGAWSLQAGAGPAAQPGLPCPPLPTPCPPHPHPDSLPQTALTFHCPSQKLFAMTDEMAEQTLVLPSLRPLGQSLCPEVPPWWLWALGAGPKHPCSKTRGFLGDKRTVSSKVLLVTEDSQEQGFADLAACRSHPGSAPGQLSQDLEGKCTHFHFW